MRSTADRLIPTPYHRRPIGDNIVSQPYGGEMEIGKEHLASGLDSFLFLCYHALFLPILLICLFIRA